jgi:hypothetical protein
MKLEDILAPCQYNPDNPPEVLEAFESELNWFGNKRNARIAQVSFDTSAAGYYTFWRFIDDDGAWCLACSKWPFSHRVLKILGVASDSPEVQIHRIQSTHRKKVLCRLFFVPQLQQYVSVTSGHGVFYSLLEEPSSDFVMNWGDIKHWQCSDTKSCFDKVFTDQESSAYFALNVIHSNHREVGTILFGFDNLDTYNERLKQFESLIVVFLRSSDSIWELHQEYTFIIGRRDYNPNSALLKTVNSQLIGVPLNNSEEKWLNLIKRFGPLRINKKLLENYYSTWWEAKPKTLISISVSAPTLHERIEAKLQLLEWAKAHLPPEKYAEVEAMET